MSDSDGWTTGSVRRGHKFVAVLSTLNGQLVTVHWDPGDTRAPTDGRVAAVGKNFVVIEMDETELLLPMRSIKYIRSGSPRPHVFVK